jgi:hypothetical protein
VLQSYLSKKLISPILLLAVTLLACGSSQPELSPPGGPIPVSQEAADRLKENFYQALQEATADHEAQLRVTNEGATSLFATELTETGRIPLSNPQIWFTSGRIYITGGVQPLGPFEFDSLIVATAVVESGQLVVNVQEAQMGMFDFPDAILASMTDTVNETLASLLIDLDITRLEILEGEMFVLGKRPV